MKLSGGVYILLLSLTAASCASRLSKKQQGGGICTDIGNSNSELGVCLAELAAQSDIACQSSCRSIFEDYSSQCLSSSNEQSFNDELGTLCDAIKGDDDNSGATAQATIFSTALSILLAVVAAFS